MKRLAILLLLQAAALTLSAQSIPVNPKPGRVSDEEVAMTAYPLDTTAAALILYQNTDSRFDLEQNGNIKQRYECYIRTRSSKRPARTLYPSSLPTTRTNT